jgi:hypothetical protein
MQYSKNFVLAEIKRIRKEVSHGEVKIHVKEIIFDEITNVLRIITKDRGSKSVGIEKADGLLVV